ncbi:BglG family transcription antiterminator LicT [Vagococcus intermedius]|uniref:PRD domain-containing protein n=1 Tax=Vagococcus intermedius TaxID=2991418 RepID=A0AAF0CU55_9ENTE|nr:PRD domain-containing protein [Vagococcus intermedius]WEG73060.1 PRD domain-containing protein [Vagococcus intermedius]WEG75144.1 PRD domain-containing protein [Vagococcus intermedius]
MKVLKILNNNAFISYDSHGKEVIVMGNGIAFGQKVGKEVTPTGRYKIFSNTDSETNERLKAIVAEIPEEYMKITERIIFILEKQYDKKINDVVYISLTEHIHGAVERHKKGIEVTNPMLMDIKRLFKDEYEIGLSAIEDIENEFGIPFGEDEAAYIAQHLIYGQLDYMTSITDVTKLMQEIIDIIKYTFRTNFNEESIYYNRFVTHLKFFAQRVVSDQTYSDENQDLFDIFKAKYLESYGCVCKIVAHIKNHYDYDLNSDEQLYLMIHIEKISTKARLEH